MLVHLSNSLFRHHHLNNTHLQTSFVKALQYVTFVFLNYYFYYYCYCHYLFSKLVLKY